MTKEETLALIAAVKEGDREAMDRLVAGNMGLCHSVATRFRDRGVEYDDLVQLAAIGMIKAIRSFDFSYSTAFSTYAVPLIIGEIRRFLRDDGTLKVGRGMKRLGGDAMRKREEFMRQHGREPKLTELSSLCGVTPEELSFALEAVGPVRSLNEPVGSEDDGASLGELISDADDGIAAVIKVHHSTAHSLFIGLGSFLRQAVAAPGDFGICQDLRHLGTCGLPGIPVRQQEGLLDALLSQNLRQLIHHAGARHHLGGKAMRLSAFTGSAVHGVQHFHRHITSRWKPRKRACRQP